MSSTLEIEFIEGRTYRYHNVDRADFLALMAADSIGAYANEVIKAKYPDYEEV